MHYLQVLQHLAMVPTSIKYVKYRKRLFCFIFYQLRAPACVIMFYSKICERDNITDVPCNYKVQRRFLMRELSTNQQNVRFNSLPRTHMKFYEFIFFITSKNPKHIRYIFGSSSADVYFTNYTLKLKFISNLWL